MAFKDDPKYGPLLKAVGNIVRENLSDEELPYPSYDEESVVLSVFDETVQWDSWYYSKDNGVTVYPVYATEETLTAYPELASAVKKLVLGRSGGRAVPDYNAVVLAVVSRVLFWNSWYSDWKTSNDASTEQEDLDLYDRIHGAGDYGEPYNVEDLL